MTEKQVFFLKRDPFLNKYYISLDSNGDNGNPQIPGFSTPAFAYGSTNNLPTQLSGVGSFNLDLSLNVGAENIEFSPINRTFVIEVDGAYNIIFYLNAHKSFNGDSGELSLNVRRRNTSITRSANRVKAYGPANTNVSLSSNFIMRLARGDEISLALDYATNTPSLTLEWDLIGLSLIKVF